MVHLTKSDLADFKHCAKDFWLRRNRPGVVLEEAPSQYEQLIARLGYEFEAIAIGHLEALFAGEDVETQFTFASAGGALARADFVLRHDDGSVDIFEIKSGTQDKADHVLDGTFQLLAAKSAGVEVRKLFLVQPSSEYVLEETFDPAGLIRLSDITEKAFAAAPDIEGDIQNALGFLDVAEIDEYGCSCVYKGRSKHCASFGYFNPNVPDFSVHDLPRITTRRLTAFVEAGQLDPAVVDPEAVTQAQKPIVLSAASGAPIISPENIRAAFERLEYPLYFIDFETFASPIPRLVGMRPHEQLPVQVSIHTLDADGAVSHSEAIASRFDDFAQIASCVAATIGDSGNLVAWNKSFESGCLRRLARLYPEHHSRFTDFDDRLYDLMDVFKADYVDAGFMGSKSIKNVLPVLCPDLTYSQLDVRDGGSAVVNWLALVETRDEVERERLREALLLYCKLDTYAMVAILRRLQAAIEGDQ